ncbi:MAG: DNA-3-methyladenine glycosylase I [Acidobacteriia bacterium]|nr:DNA-3-methyladenine glycosylase I [Terriglobia bacterium]
MRRCPWPGSDPLYLQYHDSEWGFPLHDNIKLFELLNLEGAQAGLSWITILRKRDHYRRVLDRFDPQIIAAYSQQKVETLLRDPGIVRNRAKVEGTVTNARAYMELMRKEGSFDRYLWGFVGGKPIQNRWTCMQEVPAQTPESLAMSKDLRKRGFTFVGPTICYAFMQAAGMVNGHLVDCFRFAGLR